jgi:exodeoxyribonuclease V gamma subunit
VGLSHLYECPDLEGLADAFARQLGRSDRDPLASARVVVPNPSLRRWLQIETSRRLGVAMGLRFEFLEQALWALLAEVDPAREAPYPLGADSLPWMILGQLLLLVEEPDPPPVLAPLLTYVGTPSPSRPAFERRLWQLAGRLARCFRDYEYHRTDMVAEWLFDKPRHDAGPMERAQRELFRRIFAEGGLRDRLARERGEPDRREKTLEHYGAEVLERLRGLGSLPGTALELHVAGLSSVSRFHARALRELGRLLPIHVYALTPLPADVGVEGPTQPDGALGRLGRRCGVALRAGEALLREGLTGPLEGVPPFDVERIAAGRAAGPGGSLLARLQSRLRGADGASRATADGTVEILAAPSPTREIEAIRDRALHLLESDPTLRWTDMAVFVADPETYGPALRAVLGAEPRVTPHVLSGFAAGEHDLVAGATARLVDLALGRFARAEVFELLLNPCCLAAIGATRDEVLLWREWATRLGAFYSYGPDDRRVQGYAADSLHTWEQALRRLRWGQILETPETAGGAAEPGFAGIAPFADLAAADRESVSRFTRTVEGLARAVRMLRSPPTRPAREWARALRSAVEAHLAAPPDDAASESGLRRLREVLARLEGLDLATGPSARRRGAGGVEIGLGLVREALADGLSSGSSRTGNVLLGGLTVLPLAAPLRPLPFRVVFVAGLGEQAFPGAEQPDSLDLRKARPQPGDLTLPETNSALFLEALCSARERLVLSYVDRDLQKDRELRPSQLLADLEAAVRTELLPADAGSRDRLVSRVPLHASDPCYLEEDGPPGYSLVDRLLCLEDPANRGTAPTEGAARCAELIERGWGGLRLTRGAAPAVEGRTRVDLRELARFLENPVEAGLRRHVGIFPEEAVATPRDELEPAYSANWSGSEVRAEVLTQFVRSAALGGPGLAVARSELRARARAAYGARQLASRTPAGGLGEADFEELYGTIDLASDAIAPLLADLAGYPLHEVVAVGPSRERTGLGRRFRAVQLPLKAPLGTVDVELSGEVALVWECPDRLEMLCLSGRASEPKTKRKVGGEDRPSLDRSLLPPYLLVALGALAGDEETHAFLGTRPLTVRLLCGAKLATWTLAPPPPARASRHIGALVADFLGLDGAGAWRDLLPFRVIVETDRLLESLYAEKAELAWHEEYVPLLVDAIEEAGEGLHPIWAPGGALRLADDLAAMVPADALAKVRRRLRPILGSLEAGGSDA